MGAITKIRQLSPYFLATVGVLFIAFMVIQDSSCQGSRDARRSAEQIVVAEINGDEISLADFETRVRDVIENQRSQNPGQEIDDEQVRQQIFDEMINEVLRSQEATKMGLHVSKQELIDAMVLNPSEQLQFFKDSTGKFRKAFYQDLVTNPDKIGELYAQQGMPAEDVAREVANWKKMLIQIADGLRTQKLEEALKAAIGACASNISPTHVELDYKLNNSTTDVQFVALDINRISDDAVKVSDEEIQKYYDLNKQYYEQKPARKIKYAIFPQLASAKDTANATKRSARLQTAFSALVTVEQKDSVFNVEMNALNGESFDFKSANDLDPSTLTILQSLTPKDVFGPLNVGDGIVYLRLDERREGVNPTVRSSHILINFGTNKDSAKAVANKVMGRAKKGEDFGALATEFSKDPGSAAQGGDLGYFGKGRMVKEFEEAAFAASIGEVVGPVESQFGYHIIKVTDRQNVELKYSEIKIKPSISSGTKQQIIAKAAQTAKQIEDGSPFDSVLASLKMKSTESPFFNNQTPVLSSRELMSWAFENEKGAVLRKDVKNYGIVVAQISETREVGIKQLEDVKDQITSKLMKAKKLDALKGMAESIAASAQSAGSLLGVSSVDTTLEVKTMTQCRNNGQLQGYGGEYVATQAAFSTPVGSVSKAVRGERAWFVVAPQSRVEADMNAFKNDKLAATQNLAAQARGNAYYSWFQKVRENADVVDKRNNRD
ncbi:MAG: peptidylprolyl isomerase [Ignavibacteria bacterium]|nr:peptidylprolyl isomerase [Ignavibacteria bacterium]